MSKYLAIEACPGFVKDTSSGAILNNDKNALEAYKTRRKMMRDIVEKQSRIDALEDRLERLEQLLLKVLDK